MADVAAFSRLIMRSLILLAFLLLAGTVFAAKPNVLLIVADDLGYNDVGFQGSKEIPTPHLDKLAARSLRCTSGYVSHPFCSPTRAGIMTGRYQHRFGHENNPAWLPESTTAGLSMNETTFPSLMKQAGYTTGAVGKWHLGAHPQFHPNKRGFDEYFGVLGGGHVYFPREKSGPEYQSALNRNGKDEPHTKYLTEHFGDEAAAFVGRHAGETKPWMLYLAFNAPHTPLQAPQEWIAKFSGIADKNRQVYAAMVATMDAAIGGVLAKLDETKQTENTLIYFVSDNGGPHLSFRGLTDFSDNSPLRGAKGAVYEGGMRVPFLVSWPAKIKPGTYDQPVIALDFLPTSLAAAESTDLTPKNLDGVNIMPFLTGEKSGAPHETLFWRSGGPGGNNAVRRGNLKLVRIGKAAPELYDLSVDISESKNLAAEKPEVVKELAAAIAEWEKGTIAPTFESPKTGKPATKKKKVK
jgi:arylsulfatase A-like enzyme